MADKPTIAEVLKYAKGNIMRFIGQYAADLPMEHKEEIEQTCYVRIIQAYENLDANAGWKSFVFNHCRGGVLDYVKFGKGFEETKWSLQKEEETGSKNSTKIKLRVSETESSDGGDSESLDAILSRFGRKSEISIKEIKINWSLLSCMAFHDEGLHAFAKFLIGFSVDEIAEQFGLCRARISQLISAFVQRFDDPSCSEDPWTLQTIYALGLSKRFGIQEIDQSEIHGFPIGWGSKRVDLYDTKPAQTDSLRQMSLFDVG